MNTEKNLAAKSSEVRETRAEKAIRLLMTTSASPFQQKRGEFKLFYPAVRAAKANGMKNKQIIKILAEGGLKLYPALLEKLMAAQGDADDASKCLHCGQALATDLETPASEEPPSDACPALAGEATTYQAGTTHG